jgi:hypothetical protein
MTKTIKLNTWQRMWLNNFAGTQNGTASAMRKWIRIIDAVDIDNTLANDIGLAISPQGNVAWDPRLAAKKEPFVLTFEDGDFALLAMALQTALPNLQFQSSNARSVIELLDMFGVKDGTENPVSSGEPS